MYVEKRSTLSAPLTAKAKAPTSAWLGGGGVSTGWVGGGGVGTGWVGGGWLGTGWGGGGWVGTGWVGGGGGVSVLRAPFGPMTRRWAAH